MLSNKSASIFKAQFPRAPMSRNPRVRVFLLLDISGKVIQNEDAEEVGFTRLRPLAMNRASALHRNLQSVAANGNPEVKEAVSVYADEIYEAANDADPQVWEAALGTIGIQITRVV